MSSGTYMRYTFRNWSESSTFIQVFQKLEQDEHLLNLLDAKISLSLRYTDTGLLSASLLHSVLQKRIKQKKLFAMQILIWTQ